MDWDRFFEGDYAGNLGDLVFDSDRSCWAWEVTSSSTFNYEPQWSERRLDRDCEVVDWLDARQRSPQVRAWPDWKLSVLVLERCSHTARVPVSVVGGSLQARPTSQTEERPDPGSDEHELDPPLSRERLRHIGLKDSTFERLFRRDELGLSTTFLHAVNLHRSFSAFHHPEGSSAEDLLFTARTSPSLPNDMALAVRHNAALGDTFVLLHGCSIEFRERLHGWLRAMRRRCAHPAVMIALFYELYYQELSENEVYLRITDETHRDMVTSHRFEMLTYRDGGVGAYRDRLREVTDLCDDLFTEEVEVAALRTWVGQLIRNMEIMGDKTRCKHPEQGSYMAEHSGMMMDRLRCLSDDIEVLQTKCTLDQQGIEILMTSMSSITALAMTDISYRIAVASKRDSAMMMIITVGTLTFLPATAIATIFAMPFLPWNVAASDGDSTPNALSTYLKVSLPLTVGTLSLVCLYWAKIDHPDTGLVVMIQLWIRSLFTISTPRLPNGGSSAIALSLRKPTANPPKATASGNSPSCQSSRPPSSQQGAVPALPPTTNAASSSPGATGPVMPTDSRPGSTPATHTSAQLAPSTTSTASMNAPAETASSKARSTPAPASPQKLVEMSLLKRIRGKLPQKSSKPGEV
jgi:Mg2+ and Co2+ transporter CorA